MGKKWGRTAAIFEESMGDIQRDFEGGAEIKEIAAKYEVSPPTITNWLIKAGYKHRKKGRYPQAMKDRARDLETRGWEPIAIANLFKTKLPYVLKWLGRAPEGAGIFARPRAAPMEGESQRHITGRRWTEEQKDGVMDLLTAGVFDVDQIYRLTNASRVRQQRIWRERMPGTPFPLPKIIRDRPEPVTRFREGQLAGLERAQRLAIEGGVGPIPGLEFVEQRVRTASDAEIERDLEEIEAQKRLLDEQQALPPGRRR
jgi:transposase